MANLPFKIVRASDAAASIRAKQLRRSAFDGRRIGAQASEIEARESAAYEDQQLDGDLDFARNERATVEFDETQLAAQDMLCSQQFAIMAGYAGTGKTTSVKGVLPRWAAQVTRIDWNAFRSVGKEPSGQRDAPAIALVTFTNTAARNLAAKLPEEWARHCMSIHSMLAFAPVDQEEINMETGRAKTRFEPRYDSGNKLPLDIICIDEAGIIQNDLWQQILDACEPHTRIYFLGDLAQLPAMYGASPMPFGLRKWPTIVLNKIYRQAEGGNIIPNLTRIRRGMVPVHDQHEFLCGPQQKLDQNAIRARSYLQAFISLIHKNGIWDPKQDIIITPYREGVLGVSHWNSAFRFNFNPPRVDENGRKINPVVLIKTAMGPVSLSLGDKIMATSNGGRMATENRFTNGSIGIVTGIKPNPAFRGDLTGYGELDHETDHEDSDMGQMLDLFGAVRDAETDLAADLQDTFDAMQEREDEETKRMAASHIVTVLELATGDSYELSRSAEISSLQHGYATTAHKFQGSQARQVLVICHPSMPNGLYREWLYTACSRAQRRVFLFSEPRALLRATTNSLLKGATLDEKAARLIELYRNKPGGVPFLPEPRAL